MAEDSAMGLTRRLRPEVPMHLLTCVPAVCGPPCVLQPAILSARTMASSIASILLYLLFISVLRPDRRKGACRPRYAVSASLFPVYS